MLALKESLSHCYCSYLNWLLFAHWGNLYALLSICTLPSRANSNSIVSVHIGPAHTWALNSKPGTPGACLTQNPHGGHVATTSILWFYDDMNQSLNMPTFKLYMKKNTRDKYQDQNQPLRQRENRIQWDAGDETSIFWFQQQLLFSNVAIPQQWWMWHFLNLLTAPITLSLSGIRVAALLSQLPGLMLAINTKMHQRFPDCFMCSENITAV